MSMLATLACAVVTVMVAPAQLTMKTPRATAQVTISAPQAESVQLWSSAGELSAPQPLDLGRFTATYTAPATGRPLFAVVAAWDTHSGAVGATTISLIGKVEIPVETEPGASVNVEVG